MNETIIKKDQLSPEFHVWETGQEEVWGTRTNPFFVIRNGEMRIHARRELDGDVEIIRYTDQLIRFGIDTDEKLKEWLDKGDEYFYVSMNPWYEVLSVNDAEYFSEPIFDAHEAINFSKELQDRYTDGVVNE